MNYFYFLACLGFFAAGLLGFWHFWQHLKQDFVLKMLGKKILKQQALQKKTTYFSTLLLRKALGRINNISSFDLRKNPFPKHSVSALEWEALFNPEKALSSLKKLNKKNDDATVLTIALEMLSGKENEAKKLFVSLKKNRFSTYHKAQTLVWEAIFCLREGDLLTASQNCGIALRLFGKENAYHEIAETYLLMGNIYRVSAGYDVAQLMFENAKKIFSNLGSLHGKAAVLGYLGMLTAAQNREEEARAYFSEAKDIFNSLGRKLESAEIGNQYAIMLIGSGKYKEALSFIRKNRFKGKGFRYNLFSGLNLELESQVLALQKKWTASLSAAQKAATFYAKTKNFSGYAETLFLQAQAFYKKCELDKAEKACRTLIDFYNKKTCYFYIANVYSLLALIYVQKKDFARAKALLLQSANQEMRLNRFSGAAIDYANISWLESCCNHSSEAAQNKEKALEFAQEAGETELYDLLKNNLS